MPAPCQTPESEIAMTCSSADYSFEFAEATSGTRNAIVLGGSGVNS